MQLSTMQQLVLLLAVASGAATAAAEAAPLGAVGSRRELLEVSSGAGGAGVGAAVVGGFKAPSNRYPYMAQLRRNHASQTHFCGATLIAPRILLTASHCFWDARARAWAGDTVRKPLVRLGAWEHNRGQYNSHQVIDMLVPQGYNPHTQSFDLALLLLDRPSKIAPVRLAASGKPDPLLARGRPVSVLGWGLTAFPNGTLPRFLQEAVLDYIPRKYCGKQLPPVKRHSSMICAGSPEKRRDSCSGGE